MTPADALISANVILRGGGFAEGVHRDIAKFMDLCTLIEASILHERLLCLPTDVPLDIDSLNVIRALKGEGVLWKLEFGTNELTSKASMSILDYLPDLSSADARNLLGSITGKEFPQFDISPVFDAFFEMNINDICRAAYPHIGMSPSSLKLNDMLYRFMRAISYLSIANYLNVAYFPNFDRLAIVNPLMHHSVRYVQVQFMKQANEEIRKHIKTKEERLRLAGRQINLSIPPLASVVFDKARKKKNLSDALLQAREEFAPIRQRFAKYAKLIASDDCSIEESLRALDTLENDLRTISEFAQQKSTLRMLEWRPIATFVASAIDDPMEFTSVKSWTDLAIKLLAMPLAAFQSYIRRRRVQPILDIPGKVQQIRGLTKLTDDLFSWYPSNEELIGIRKFSEIVTQHKSISNDALKM